MTLTPKQKTALVLTLLSVAFVLIEVYLGVDLPDLPGVTIEVSNVGDSE